MRLKLPCLHVGPFIAANVLLWILAHPKVGSSGSGWFRAATEALRTVTKGSEPSLKSACIQ
jgi:hypothetical protein